LKEDLLDERQRAEDILLGSLGYGSEARVVSLSASTTGYKGIGSWPDGESFEFESEGELDSFQHWALGVMGHKV
jgi:hypothetical protein